MYRTKASNASYNKVSANVHKVIAFHQCTAVVQLESIINQHFCNINYINKQYKYSLASQPSRSIQGAWLASLSQPDYVQWQDNQPY